MALAAIGEWWSDVRYRLRAVVRRVEIERELAMELEDHLEREAEAHRKHGLPPHEAMRRARLAFGGIDRSKELSRDGRGVGWLDAGVRNLRFAWRSTVRRPGLALAIAVTLGLGLGANAAMFGVVDRLLLQAPPYMRDPGHVNRVYLSWRLMPLDQGTPHEYMEYTRFRDLARWTTAFSQVAGFKTQEQAVGLGSATREVTVSTVSASFFDFFDAPPVLGRYFTAAEDSAPMGSAVAVVSYPFWLVHYGGQRDVLGRVLQVGHEAYTIIGVAPGGFAGMSDGPVPSVYVPLTRYAATAGFSRHPGDYATNYHWAWVRVMVRRRPGVSDAVSSSDLTNAFRRSYLAQRAQDHDAPPLEFARPHAVAASVVQERGPIESATARVATWVGGVAIIVLVIAWANVANLLLARGRERRGEIALRLALGVSQGRLIAQLLTESLLLAGCGAMVGIVVAQVGGSTLHALFVPDAVDPPVLAQPRTLVFAAMCAVLTAVAIGLVPAAQARRTDLVEAFTGRSRGGARDRSKVRAILLLVQGALSVLLLVGAGLFIRSTEHVRAVHLGYDVDPVLYTEIDDRGTKLDSTARHSLGQRLRDAAAHTPGVVSAAIDLAVPFMNSMSTGLAVPGIDSVDRLGRFTLQAVSPEYFQTVGTRILRGRSFTSADGARDPRVTVVGESMANVLWPGRDPIGQRIRIGDDTVPYATVVGIAEDIRGSDLGVHELHYYVPAEQFDRTITSLFVRTSGDARVYQGTIRRELQRLMPGAAYVSVTPMGEILDREVRSWRLGATMFVAFGVLALVVAAVGLYSVVSYDVARRGHEIGVRVALGARAHDVLHTVAGESVRFAIAGVVVGLTIALVSGRWIAPLLFAESPRDPVVFGAVFVVLAVAVIAATIVPVLRARRVDPATALRAE
jgi:predicted permease